MNRVVVTGLGVLAPNGHGLDEFEHALREGRSGVSFEPRMAELDFACQVAGVPRNIDAMRDRYFDERTQIGMDRHAVIGCIAGLDCWDDAGLPRDSEAPVDWDAGIAFGTGIGAIETAGRTLIPMTDTRRAGRMGSAIPERIMCSAAAARLAGLLGVGGHVSTVSSACATGTEAVIIATA